MMVSAFMFGKMHAHIIELIFVVDLCCIFFFPFGFYTSIESASTFLFLGLAMVFLDLLWRVEQKDARYVKEAFGLY